jgi:hypothetical protein
MNHDGWNNMYVTHSTTIVSIPLLYNLSVFRYLIKSYLLPVEQ